MLRRFASPLLAAAALALAVPVAFGQTDSGDALTAKAVGYLDTLRSVKATFEQTDPHGRTAGGTVWLERPGRARFQYDAPSDLLITSDGRTVIVSDPRLRTFQRLPLSSSPLSVFLADRIRLDRGVRIVRIDRTDQGFAITARDARGLAQGQLTLYFDEHPMRLAGWAIRDGAGRVTRVTLGQLTEVAPPPADFFTQSRSAAA